jgi:glycosyltransferase involved in cell wall biosynthesis
MKIHLYAQIRNEARILDYFLRHYAFCEKIFLFDNHSTDDSVQTARKYPNVVITEKYGEQSHQEHNLIHFKNNIWKQSRKQCDYVIVCDADEFLWSASGLVTDLAYKKQKCVTIPKVEIGYQMVGIADKETYLLTDTIRTGVFEPLYAKQIIFNPNAIEEINFSLGSHKYHPIGKNLIIKGQLSVLHYKYINSYKEVAAHYQDRNAHLSKADREARLGYQWTYTEEKVLELMIDLSERAEEVI